MFKSGRSLRRMSASLPQWVVDAAKHGVHNESFFYVKCFALRIFSAVTMRENDEEARWCKGVQTRRGYMYIKKVDLKNIKALNQFSWELGADDSLAGWHVLLGDNGSGKSTFLRACAVGLLGPKNALGLRLPWNDWIAANDTDDVEARIALTLFQDPAFDDWSGQGNTKAGPLKLVVKITPEGIDDPQLSRPSPTRHIWGGSGGWFSASFGPFRRFSGGNAQFDKLFYSAPKLASHLSLFGEDVALSETLTWLQELHYGQLIDEKKGAGPSSSARFLDQLKAFINQDGFLPNGSRLTEIKPKEVMFVDGNGVPIEINTLSDGFRSILSLTLELLRQLGGTYGLDRVFNSTNLNMELPGVVLIDEIDVHLHPKWQRLIGPWLTQHFPNIQFIVTTHSPLICQGAARGSITRLPNPTLGDMGGRVTGPSLDRLLYGDILEALSSGAFGAGIERSEEAKRMLRELAQLNVRSRRHSLNSEDERRKHQLQLVFGGEPDIGSEQ